MALVFRYVALPSASPIISLGGRMDRAYPLVRVSLVGPSGTFIERAFD